MFSLVIVGFTIEMYQYLYLERSRHISACYCCSTALPLSAYESESFSVWMWKTIWLHHWQNLLTSDDNESVIQKSKRQKLLYRQEQTRKTSLLLSWLVFRENLGCYFQTHTGVTGGGCGLVLITNCTVRPCVSVCVCVCVCVCGCGM